jgi:hypothetical protein
MPLHSKNSSKGSGNRLLVFVQNNYLLPGKPLTPNQLSQLIENSRNSGIISMEDAHQLIRNSYKSG